MEEKENVKNPQCLIKLLSGDQILIDVKDQDHFVKISYEVFGGGDLSYIMAGNFAVNKSQVLILYYFPEGYEKSCGSYTKG